jgi:SagB-type dehydrogenase family enzyme
LVLLTAVLLCACQSEGANDGGAPQLEDAEEVELLEPRTSSGASLEAAIAARRSRRDFTGASLTQEQLSQLLWAAQGITGERYRRAAPSAGALYPLELYVATAEGTYHYLPEGHRLEPWQGEDVREALWRAGLEQEALREAPAVFVLSGVYERTAAKYGDRAERYVHLEAGHAAQNLLLQAVALDLGAVPIGAFHDDQVREVLGLSEEHAPLYLIPVGHPE